MKFIIKDISPNRQELRVTINPVEIDGDFYYSTGTINNNFDANTINQKFVNPNITAFDRYVSLGPEPARIRLLVAYLKDYFSLVSVNDSYVLTHRLELGKPITPMDKFGEIPIINISVEDISLVNLSSDTIPSMVIKLLNPLPATVAPLSEITIQKQIISSQQQDFAILPEITEPEKFRGLDYDIDALSKVESYDNKNHEFENFNELTGSKFKSSDNSIFESMISSSHTNLRIDYSKFKNHVHFGSAVKKIENFKTKIIDIENTVNKISASLQTTGSLVTDNLRIGFFDEIQRIKNTFSPFEEKLYYEANNLNQDFPINIGQNYINSLSALNERNSNILYKKFGFGKVYYVSGSNGNDIPLFSDKYFAENEPFYNYSGSLYLSFLMKGDESITSNDNIHWQNNNLHTRPRIPKDALYTSSLLQPSVSSGSWQRYIYVASQSYWVPSANNPSVGLAGGITNFEHASSEVSVLSGSFKTGSYAITAGGRYSNLSTYVTGSNMPFSGSILPSGELFKLKIKTSNSSQITASYITDVKITKENPIDFKPFYNIYSTGSTQWKNWYDNQIASASDYDRDNIHSLHNNLPQYLINDTTIAGVDFESFLSMLGEHYDLIRNYVDGYKHLINTDYDINKTVPDNLLPAIANIYNWNFKLPFNKYDDAQISNFIGASLDDIKDGKTKTIMNNIHRNVINDIYHIYKSKGTKKSIHSLLNSYGIPSDIFKIKEHGASLQSIDDSVLTDDVKTIPDGISGQTGSLSFTNRFDKLVSYIFDGPDRRIYAEWAREDLVKTPFNAIQFIFKANRNTYPQILVESSGSAGQKANWNIWLEPSGSSDTRARIWFRLNNTKHASSTINTATNTISMSSGYHDFKNQNFWNVLVQKKDFFPSTTYGDTLLTSHSYELMVGEQSRNFSDVIDNFEVTTMTLGGTEYSHSLENFISTGSRPTIIGGNLTLGKSLTGSMAEVRTWKYPLSASKFKHHILDKKSTVGNNTTGSLSDMIYHFKLNENYNSGSKNQKIKDSNAKNVKDYTMDFSDEMTGSLANRVMYQEEEINRILFNVRMGASLEENDEAILINPEVEFIGNLNPDTPSFLDVYNPLINKRQASSIIEIVKSPQDMINNFIREQLGSFDFNDKFADPRDINKLEYKELNRFAKDFLDHFDVSLNVNKYIEAQSNLFNKDLVESLGRLLPARASFDRIGVELKPTYFDRPKIQNHKFTQEVIDIKGEESLSDFEKDEFSKLRTNTDENWYQPSYNGDLHTNVTQDSSSANPIVIKSEKLNNYDVTIGVTSITGSKLGSAANENTSSLSTPQATLIQPHEANLGSLEFNIENIRKNTNKFTSLPAAAKVTAFIDTDGFGAQSQDSRFKVEPKFFNIHGFEILIDNSESDVSGTSPSFNEIIVAGDGISDTVLAGRLQTILRGNTLGTTLAKVGAGAQNLINLVLVPSITFTQDGKKIDAQVNFAGDFYNDKQLVEHISGFEIAHDDRKFDGAKPIVSKRYEDKDGPKVSMETQRILSKNATLDFVNELSIPDGTPGLFQFSNEEPLVESKKATMEISNVDSGIVSFEKLEKLHTSNDTHLVIADASGSLTNISAELRVPHRAELYFENSQSFSDRFYQGYETLDKEALWGTSSSDVHFIQFPTGSEGKFGDHNTYHYDNRYVFRMIGDVETISGSYPRDKGAFETDYDGTYVSVNNYTASKDFNNQTNIVSNPDIGLGSRPLGITNQFKANTEFTYGGKYLDETFVYPPNHTFLIGTSKDDLDICYDGTQNTGEKFFNSNYWTDLSGDAFYSITNTGQQQATVTYD